MDVKTLREKKIWQAYDEMRPETAETVKALFLDGVLSLMGGMLSVPEAEKEQLLGLLKEEPELTRAAWPEGLRMSREMAGFINGYCLRYADWGDAMRPPRSRGGHPSDMCAALLALCDEKQVSGKRALEALHVGYQMWVLVQNRMMYRRPELDPTSWLSLTLPVMLGVFHGDSGEKIQNVLNLSASSGTTLLQVRPADITNLKCGATGYAIARAFWLYRMSCFLEAPGSMFTGQNGWYRAVAEFDGDVEKMDEDEVYAQIQVKALPCCNVNQASSECGIRLHGRIGGDSSRIESVKVHVSPTDAGIALKPGKPQYPYDHPSADHHIKFCLAVALKYGALGPTHYDPAVYEDPEVRRLMDVTEGVTLTESELAELGGGKGPCQVGIRLKGGTILTESVERPAGYFVGLGAGERNAGLQKTVRMKKEILEKCYGTDLTELMELAAHLEQHETRELVDVVQQALKHMEQNKA